MLPEGSMRERGKYQQSENENKCRLRSHLKLLLIRQDAADHVGNIPAKPIEQERQSQAVTRLLEIVLNDLRSLRDDPTGDGEVSKQRRKQLRSEVGQRWKHGESRTERGEHVGVRLLL